MGHTYLHGARVVSTCLAIIAFGVLLPAARRSPGANSSPTTSPVANPAVHSTTMRANPADAAVPPVTVLIAYASRTGATEAMSQAVELGATSVPGTRVVRRKVDAVSEADLLAAHAIVVGTPVHNGGVAAEVKAFIDRWPFGQLQNRVGAVFVAAGGTSSGEELAMVNVLTSMLVYRFVIVGGEQSEAAFGASAITFEGRPAPARGTPDEVALGKARSLGERVARVARALVAGGWPDRRAPAP